ncbi:sporulation protein [Ectobacillus funiculus]|uniref:sporulation protein n=1 Tax=Ectobacillus funiculus TaxID=137993 RepID=UPI00101B92A1|nr:sporulation protein [Ectobacillus funiculus]
MFKKFLARLGKGAATVDLRFEGRPYRANETVQGEVLIQGGEVEQKINHLAAKLIMNVNTKQGTVAREVTTIPLSSAFTIFPKEQKAIPFTYTIPANLPVSRGTVSYYFDTHLDIDGGVDRTDLDRLIVEAPKDVQAVFQALQQLGFHEKPSSGKLDTYGQEFAFFPTTLFVGQVSEIELRFASEAMGGLRIWMEVDCRGAYHEVEAKRELFLDQDTLQDAEELVDILRQTIIEATEQPHSFMHPFSYEKYGHHGHHSHGHHGSSVAGMVGGLAMGILGAMLLEEMMGEALEAAGEALGFEEEDSEEESGFGDFFGGDDGEF